MTTRRPWRSAPGPASCTSPSAATAPPSRGGIAAARGRYVIMGDADDSYDFGRLEPFVDKLRQGYPAGDGQPLQGRHPAAAPCRRCTAISATRCSASSAACYSARGSATSIAACAASTGMPSRRLGLRTQGMEFASELVVKAALAGWRVAEVPITLHPDGRGRPAHLRSWRDGWRHLRFLLLFSPRWLFLYPGLALLACGIALTTALYFCAAAGAGRRARHPQHALRFGRGACLACSCACSRCSPACRRRTPGCCRAGRRWIGCCSVFTLERGLLLGLAAAGRRPVLERARVLAMARSRLRRARPARRDARHDPGDDPDGRRHGGDARRPSC